MTTPRPAAPLSSLWSAVLAVAALCAVLLLIALAAHGIVLAFALTS